MYARFEQASKLTINPNGGEYESSTSNKIINKLSSDSYTLSTPTKEGSTFKGWYTAQTGGNKVTSETVVRTASNHTLYARWEAASLVFNNKEITKSYSDSSQTFNVDQARGGSGTYTYAKKSGDSNITVSSAGVVTIGGSKAVGEYTVVITATDTSNNTGVDATYTITIEKAPTICPSIEGYEGTYDTSAHGITVGTATGGTIQYRTDPSGSWSSTKPTLTNAGEITTYVRVLGDSNHTTRTCGSEKVIINKIKCNAPTNVQITTAGVVTWTTSSNCSSVQHQISYDGTNYSNATNGANYNSSITSATGTRTAYIRAVPTNTNYDTSNAAHANTTVYTINFASNDTNKGTVSPTSVNVISGATVETSGNNLLIKGITTGTTTNTLATITPTPGTIYNFTSWSKTSGSLTSAQTITATFTIKDSYSVKYWNSYQNPIDKSLQLSTDGEYP